MVNELCQAKMLQDANHVGKIFNSLYFEKYPKFLRINNKIALYIYIYKHTKIILNSLFIIYLNLFRVQDL